MTELRRNAAHEARLLDTRFCAAGFQIVRGNLRTQLGVCVAMACFASGYLRFRVAVALTATLLLTACAGHALPSAALSREQTTWPPAPRPTVIVPDVHTNPAVIALLTDLRARKIVSTPAEDSRVYLQQQMYHLGFGRLENHPDQCRLDAQGNGECTADSSYSVIRARLPDGILREVRNYHTYANDPAALTTIREFLGRFRPPTPARLYRPERATLFLGPVYGDDSAVAYRAWPLAPTRLQPPNPRQTTWAIVVTGNEWDAVVKVSGPALGQRFMELNGRRYAAYLMPWLPGVDYTAQVTAYGDPLPATSAPTLVQP